MAISIAPMHWPSTAKEALTPTEEEMKRSDKWSVPPCPTGTCAIPLQIMIGFDGTNNNMERDLPDRAHSNVARLFGAFPSVDAIGNLNRVGHYSYYVPGVGTRFEENEEWRESADGKVKGKGSRERVMMGIADVFNAVHRYLQNGQLLFDGLALTQFIREKMLHPLSAEEQYLHHRKQMDRVFGLSASHKPVPGKLGLGPIDVYVFGFSRGAMEAVAFCHEFKRAFPDGKVCGVSISIKFLGLMDCVSSTGLADTTSRFNIAPITGHAGPGDFPTKPLPDCVKKAVHLVAAHEQRTAFPLDLVLGAGMDTYVYPGVHSNVGGGYGWNAQGRAPSDGLMLSQIPLMHMYRLARSYGVPLLSYQHMAPDVKSDFELDPKLVKAWNTYMACMDFEYVKTKLGPQVAAASEGKLHALGLNTCSSFNTLVRQHMRMRYAQLAKYLQNQRLIDDLPGVPSSQDREDLISCINSQLFSDYELCQLYFTAPGRMSSHYTPDEQQQFDHHKGRASLSIRAMAYWRSNTGGQEAYIDRGREMPWIQWAFEQLDANVKGRAGAVQGTAYFELMHQHTNDSLAGFYLLGFASNAEKAEKLEAVVAKQQAGKKLNKLESKIYANYKDRVDRQGDKKLQTIINNRLEARSRKLAPDVYAREFGYSSAEASYLSSPGRTGQTVIPTLSDADVLMLLEDTDFATKVAVPEITSTRREGGGYFVQRAVFINGKRQQLAE